MKSNFIQNILPTRLFNGAVNFVLPETCLVCGAVINSPARFICPECRKQLLPFNGQHPWRENETSAGTIDNSLSLYEFAEGTAIQTLLHALKYTKFKSIGRMFGEEIGCKISAGEVKYDFAVPVPLHRAKERERTYNQSDFICKGISESLGAKNLPRCLKRTRFTETQTQLHKSERLKNVHGAFELNPKFKELIAGRNIIVADDVITTGSTILECARVLKQNGCGKVLVASIAYATLD